ncbi:2,3-dihydroxybenzoate-AMP ligase [Lentzea jiangxiensis]|uniref:2,3-dihydroxybenzoate-AMP ligase n=1 Tax=Lentzea jiangxiensis TaxID=641025 RepID=A0A1H0WVI3_9PSEU|nr:2,3-dihydroxybenzoate-AMP ligase [Lentzea jiangxiensis]
MLVLDGFVPWPLEVVVNYIRSGHWEDRTLPDVLLAACAQNSSRTALVRGDDRITYAELERESAGLAVLFQRHRIRPLDRVVLQLPNTPRFVTTLLALLRIGAIPVLALPGHRHNELTQLADRSGAVACVVPDRHEGFDHGELARSVLAEVNSVRHVFVDGEPAGSTQLEPDFGPDPAPVEIDPTDPALFLLSGGTTGVPKLIPRTHQDYLCGIRASSAALLDHLDPVYLAVNPVAHTAALGCPGVLGTLLAGGTAVLATTRRPAELFELIERERVSLTTLVPPLVRTWVDAARKQTVSLPRLMLQVGSAKFGMTEAREARKLLGCSMSNWFGVGEGMMTWHRVENDSGDTGGEGRPLLSADEIVVVDEHDNPLPPGREGALLVRGPYTIRAYFRAPEINADSFTSSGFFRTGDLARINADGELDVLGRIKDIVNRGGNKVPVEEVEHYLLTYPGVIDAAVFGVPDAVLGERTHAHVVMNTERPEPGAIKRHLRARGLATYKIPDRVVFAAQLPRTPVGKLDRRALAAESAGARAK